jgi:hypothetical protein
MGFHLAAYNASILNGAVLLPVAPIPDPVIAPLGVNGFAIHPTYSKIMQVAAFGVNLTRAQLTSGSLRRWAPFDINPVNVGSVMASPVNYLDFSDAPLDLVVGEELDAFAVQSNVAAQRAGLFVWFCDAPIRPYPGRYFTMHWTAAFTAVANTWSALTPVFDNGLVGGKFAIVGSDHISASAVAHRIVPRDGTVNRPGAFSRQTQGAIQSDDQRYGLSGLYNTFTTASIPQIEVFCGAADTTHEGYLDMVQIG